LSYGEKKQNFEKKKLVAMTTSLEKSRLRLIIYSHSGTERVEWHRVKIRPVEAEIKWLTGIVKKEIRYRSKTYGYPTASHAGTGWPN